MPDESESIEELIGKVESVADPAVTATVRKLVQSVLDLHAAGLERIVQIASGAAGLTEKLIADETVRGLLLLHDLHPVALQERVEEALKELQPYLKSHGAEVDLAGTEGGVIRLRTHGAGHGCVRSAIEDAIYNAAPDLDGLVMEEETPPSNFVPVAVLSGR
jgi:NifU-like domain